jgi:hypothetical protein
LSDWREAEALAHAAERRAFDEAMTFLEGKGPAPAPEQWEHCKRLRKAADDSFQLVVGDWNALGKTARPVADPASFAGFGRTSAA